MRWILLSCVALLSLCASTVHAEVQRFALIVGNNLGHGDELPLLYAEADAAKVHGVLRELGRFEPVNMVLLQGESATTARRTLIALNERIREAEERGDETMLFVYYSGHADADALHLGSSRFRMHELAQLVRGSAATFRLLIADACRSGALTRSKGGRAVPPFAVPLGAGLPGKGVAFLTATSASEDAQESDALHGSFFTHALVSGLLGAADRDHDRLVSLEEVYRHAYDVTVRETSRTAYGVQHPSFDYDLRGQDGVILTRLDEQSRERALLMFPSKLGFVVLRESSEGAVVAELPAYAEARVLSLRPGRYFVRGRALAYLLEGSMTLRAGARSHVDPTLLERVAYARYVRKGQNDSARAHALELGATLHSRAQGADTSCPGAALGYVLALMHVSLEARLGFCQSRINNVHVEGASTEYEATGGASYPLDLRFVTLAAGVGAGGLLTHQRFESRGLAPNRSSSEPFVYLGASLTSELAGRWFVRLDARIASHLIRVQSRGASNPERTVDVTLRGALLVGTYLGTTR